MAYSVVTGPINFGPAPSEQAGDGPFEVDPFMEQLSSAADVDLAAEATHLQPRGSWRDTTDPAVQPEEHMRSNAGAQHAARTGSAAIVEQQTQQDALGGPDLAPTKVETSSKGHASNDICEELTSVTELGQPHDRQHPTLEAHEASLPPVKEAHSICTSHKTLDSMQHAAEVRPGDADAESAAPVISEPANVEQTVQQDNHTAARALAGPVISTGAADTHELEFTSKQHEQQAEASLPRLQPVIPDQPTNTASIAHTGKGPTEAEHLRNDQQLGSSILTDPAARAGTASMQHITDVLSLPDSMLQHEAGTEQTAQQQANTEERDGPVQHSSSNADSMSASAEAVGGLSNQGLSGSSIAASAIRPAAAPAGPPAYPQSLQHTGDQPVSATPDAGARSDGQIQVPDQQQGPSLPAHSSVREGPAQSQPHSAEKALSDRDAEHTRSPYEGSSTTAQSAFPATLAPSSSNAQPASSDESHKMPHAPDAHGSPGEELQPSAASLVASAGPTHALQTEDRQPEIQDVHEPMGASRPLSEATTQAGNDKATQHAESEAATQEELLALAEAVSRLEADLADAREAVATHEREAEAARQEAAQLQDREADARAQVVLVILPAVVSAVVRVYTWGCRSAAVNDSGKHILCKLIVWMRQQLK